MTPSGSNPVLSTLKIGDEIERIDFPWKEYGLAQAPRLQDTFRRLVQSPNGKAFLNQYGAAALTGVAYSSDPEKALALLDRWLDAAKELALSECEACGPLARSFIHTLCMLFAATPALSEHLIRFPARARPVVEPVVARTLKGGLAWRERVQQALNVSLSLEPHLRRDASFTALRRVRAEAMLQISALDLLGTEELVNTVRALSDLADACVEGAVRIAEDHLYPVCGGVRKREVAALPADAPLPFVVIAFGKLGGRELNYSSDIDLVFGYEGEGVTSGGEHSIEYREYFRRIGEEVIAALDALTGDGRVYRVDMRLRPYGAAGPLVMTVNEIRSYLEAEGRTWERQAWLKARPVGGDMALGDALLRDATAFVFRRYLSLDSINDIKNLKKQIEQSVARRGETEDEVKLGRGGIRDIEFTVQFLQLLHGGSHPSIRGGNTLRTLYSLRREGLLTQAESEPFERAYVFLRNLEHRLQIYGDQQTHLLPADPQVRRRIAKSLRYSDGAMPAESLFEADRQRHIGRVREIFEGLFASLFVEKAGPEGELSALLLAPQPDLKMLAALMPRFGLQASEETARELCSLGTEKFSLSSPSRTRKFFASLAPLLLRSLSVTGDPDAALKRFSRVAQSLGARGIFYQALHENPKLLRVVCDLSAYSEFLTDILVANPGLIDDLVDALSTNRAPTQQELERELSQLIMGGDPADTLRAFRAGALLRIGVKDLIHSTPIEQTQQELSDLAAVVLRAEFNHIYKVFTKEKGELKTPDGKPVGFAILGVGKLGGREMNYGSDLDVLYFYDLEGESPKGLPSSVYLGELAQTLTRAMGERTVLGTLYTLDARLRPNGNKGPLALSLDAFEKYSKDGDLCDWERLALTRTRFIAGDERVGERAEHLIRTTVYSPLRSTTLATEVRNMRRRLEDTAEAGDVKRGKGALTDIEFLVQYLQLVHGPAFPPLRKTSTKDALKALIKFKKLNDKDGKLLQQAYEFFSLMANRLRVVHGLSASTLPQNDADLRKLALRAGYIDDPDVSSGQALLKDYERYTVEVRKIFEKIVH